MVIDGKVNEYRSKNSVRVERESSLDIMSFAELDEVAPQGRVRGVAEHARYPEEAYALRDWYQKKVSHSAEPLSEPASFASLSSSCDPSLSSHLRFDSRLSPPSPATCSIASTICGADSKLSSLNSTAYATASSSATPFKSQAPPPTSPLTSSPAGTSNDASSSRHPSSTDSVRCAIANASSEFLIQRDGMFARCSSESCFNACGIKTDLTSQLNAQQTKSKMKGESERHACFAIEYFVLLI